MVDVNTKTYNTLYKLNNSCTYTKASIVLTIKLNNKKTVEVEVFTTSKPIENSFYSSINWKPAEKIEYQASKYNVGDKVCNFYLFNHLFVENKNEQTVTCIICGTVHPQKTTKYAICNHSILNFNI